MPPIFHALEKIKPAYDITDKIVMILCKVLLIADIAIATYTVLGRYCQQLAIAHPDFLGWLKVIKDPAWSEEVILTCMSYMAVLAAALAIRHGSHIRMNALDRYLPPVAVKILDVVADVAVLAFGVFMLVEGWNYTTTLGSVGFYISMPWLSKFWMYFPIPLAGLAMIIFELEAIFNHVKAFFEPDEKKEA